MKIPTHNPISTARIGLIPKAIRMIVGNTGILEQHDFSLSG